MGVFLGLAGEQWRENAEHREQARASLERFRTEIQANRKSVVAVMNYHVVTRQHLVDYLAIDPAKRDVDTLSIQGLQPASFQRASWDLALVNQSLAYIDPELVLALSRVYTEQEAYLVKTAGITQAMYLQPPRANGLRFPEPLLAAMTVYYDDLVVVEPALLKLYDQVLSRLDKELGDSRDE